MLIGMSIYFPVIVPPVLTRPIARCSTSLSISTSFAKPQSLLPFSFIYIRRDGIKKKIIDDPMLLVALF